MDEVIQVAANEPPRRNFIRAACAGIAAVGLSHTIKVQNATAIELAPKDRQPPDLVLPEGPSKKVRWAVAGLGELALTQILPAFKLCALSTVTALVSGHSEKANAVAEQYGIDKKNIYSYETFDRIKDNDQIDAVYIVLPNSMHAEYTVRALQAGKDVLCEKPLAPSVAEAEEMIAAGKRTERKLMAAYRMRYEPFNQKMIEMARSEKYGKIRIIEANNVQNVKAPNIRLSRQLKGGPLGDVGIYCINAFRYLTGEEPVEVNAMLTNPTNDPRFAEVEDRILFQYRFPSGILASGAAGFSAQTSRRYKVLAEKAWFELDPAFSYSGQEARIGSEGKTETLLINPTNHFAAEMDHFSACIQNKSEPTTPGEEGLADIKIIEATYRAARERKAITI